MYNLAIKTLLRKGGVNSSYENGRRPLHIAAESQPEVINSLIEAGADVNATEINGLTPLHFAAKYQPTAIAPLIKAGADVNIVDNYGKIPFDYATSEETKKLLKPKYINKIQELLDKHDVNAKSEYGYPILTVAVFKQPEVISSLIYYGEANVNATDNEGMTPFMEALSRGMRHKEYIIELFIKAGADPNIKNIAGNTALHIAITGNYSILQLIQAGADVNIKNKMGMTPLVYAVRKGRLTAVSEFIKAGADLNSVDEMGRTALHYAVMSKGNEIIKLLVKYGADTNIKDNSGKTPNDLTDDPDIGEILNTKVETKGLKDYEIIEGIGKGSFGEVFKAIRKSDGKVIALKTIDASRHHDLTTIMTEVNTLKKLSDPDCNPFVVCYYGSYHDELNEEYLIEMEYIDGVEMLDFVKNRASTDEEYYYYLLLIARDISKGLEYVHQKGIIHNDIKLANIIIQKDTYIPKIIDFGISCSSHGGPKYKKSNYCVINGGTHAYLAPEFFGDNFGLRLPASDMWALGVLLYIAATGRGIFDANNNEEFYYKLKNAGIPKLNTTNNLLNYIVNNLLVRDPESRLKPSEVVNKIDKEIVRPEPKKGFWSWLW